MSASPSYIPSVNDPSITTTILNENSAGDAYAPQPHRMSPHNCRAYARTKTNCVQCGKEFHINRLRCRNPYLCDNCGGKHLWSWKWHQERDVANLERMQHTGIELGIPADISLPLRAREDYLLSIYDKFIDQLNVAQVRMPVINPRSTNSLLRASLIGRHGLKELTRQWKALTGGKGWVSIRHYRPGDDSLIEFFEWVFSGLEPLHSLPDSIREDIAREFESSQRISATRSSVYSPLPKSEQKIRRAEHQERHRLHLCSCCGAPMRKIPVEEQEVMTIEDMQKKYPDCRIIVEDEFDAFEDARFNKVSNGRIRNYDGDSELNETPATKSPPS